MKHAIPIILIFVSLKVSFSQTPFKDTLTNKYGYIDSSGNHIIEAKYESAYKFYNAYAIVISEEYHGLINRSGKYILKPKYNFISLVHKNHVIVKQDTNNYQLINLSGNVFTEFEYLPMSYEYRKENIYDAEYKDDKLIKRLISMWDNEVRPDRHKITSECIISMSSFSEYFAGLLINYILENKQKIKEDIIIYDRMEKEIREGLKSGRWHIE